MQTNNATSENQQAPKTNAPVFDIQRLYVAGASLETPNSPGVFRAKWNPDVQIDLNAKTDKLGDDVYQVQISITATAKLEDKVAFLVEVDQAGIFTIQGLTEPQLQHTLGAYCPNILFPYARELISDLVSRAGFPPLYLAPINFDALYAQQQQANQQAQTEAAGGKQQPVSTPSRTDAAQ